MAILKVDTISGIGTEGPVFEGDIEFTSQNFLTLPKGDTTQRGRGRGLYAGGYCPNNTETIQFIDIQSQGNTQDFGDLSTQNRGVTGFGSKTRAIFAGGAGGSPTGSTLTNVMEFVTIATTSNSTDFGDLNTTLRNIDGCSNETRGILFGGQTPASPNKQNNIQFVTIASTGDASDFGDMSRTTANGTAFASSTRGIQAGGFPGGAPTSDNIIEFITIATTGDVTDFGDLTGATGQSAGCSSNTRGIICTGSLAPDPSVNGNVIQFVTMASAGNATDFGDYVTVGENVRGVSNTLRGVFAGGYCPVYVNTMAFITIATTGNATDFGDILNGQTSPNNGLSQAGATSDSHGGLLE